MQRAVQQDAGTAPLTFSTGQMTCVSNSSRLTLDVGIAEGGSTQITNPRSGAWISTLEKRLSSVKATHNGNFCQFSSSAILHDFVIEAKHIVHHETISMNYHNLEQ